VSIERVATIVSIVSGAVFGSVLFLFALTDNWGKVETTAKALYPFPLLIFALVGLAVVTALLVR